MLSRHYLLIPGLLIAMACACHKPESIRKQSTYTFSNQTGRDVTFDVYKTEKDYANETGRLLRHLIPANSAQKVVFEVGQTYWIDWYSADYSYNNWVTMYNGAQPEARLLSVAAADDSRFLRAALPDTSRSVLLNGATSSTWRGTLAKGSSMDGTHEFIFRKDFSGEHTYTNPGGATSTEPFTYNLNGVNVYNGEIQRFTLHIRNEQHDGIFSVACLMWDFPQQTGRDSLLVEPIYPYSTADAFIVGRQ